MNYYDIIKKFYRWLFLPTIHIFDRLKHSFNGKTYQRDYNKNNFPFLNRSFQNVSAKINTFQQPFLRKVLRNEEPHHHEVGQRIRRLRLVGQRQFRLRSIGCVAGLQRIQYRQSHHLVRNQKFRLQFLFVQRYIRLLE